MKAYDRKILLALVLLAGLILGDPLHCEPSRGKMSSDITHEFELRKGKRSRFHNYWLEQKSSFSRVVISSSQMHKTDYYIFEYSSAPVRDIKAKLNGKKLDKGRVTVSLNRRRDTFFSEDKVRHISYPQILSVGDSLFYSFRKEYDDIAYFPIIVIPNEDFLRSFVVSVEIPEEIDVQFDVRFTRDSLPYSITKEKNIVSIRFASVEYSAWLELFPYNYSHAFINVTLKSDSTVISGTNEDSFLKWYSSLTSLKPTFDITYDPQTFELTDKWEESEEILEDINRFVRGNVRYIGDVSPSHKIIPYNPDSVLNWKYGDCKDRVSLSSAIASSCDIDINMALVTSGRVPAVDWTHVTLFDHVICNFASDTGDVFFDPTATYTKFGQLPQSIIGKDALILDPDSPRIVRLRGSLDSPSLYVNVSVSTDSVDRGVATIRLKNNLRSRAMYARREFTAKEYLEVVLGIVKDRISGLELSEVEPISVDEDALNYRAVSDLSGLFVETASNLYVPSAPIKGLGRAEMSRSDDPYPISYQSQEFVSLQIEIQDSRYDITGKSSSLGKGDRFSFTNSIARIDSTRILCEYQLIRNGKFFAKDEKEKYLEFCSEYIRTRKDMFVLERKSP